MDEKTHKGTEDSQGCCLDATSFKPASPWLTTMKDELFFFSSRLRTPACGKLAEDEFSWSLGSDATEGWLAHEAGGNPPRTTPNRETLYGAPHGVVQTNSISLSR